MRLRRGLGGYVVSTCAVASEVAECSLKPLNAENFTSDTAILHFHASPNFDKAFLISLPKLEDPK